MLNKNEVRVLDIIEQDPFISQQSIADELGLTRSTVATIISGLTQKKHLLGRAYVINRASGIYCIGAMNVDRKFNLFDNIAYQTSNPSVSTVNVGGVARNIAENLGRLDMDVSLISLGGHDQDYHFVKRETEPYVNMQHATQLNGLATGTYNAVIDPAGEMQLAVADMQIYDEMTVEWLSNFQSILQEARLLVIDLNLPRETVEYTLTLARQFEIDIFVIPVSGPKMDRLPEDLSGVTWLIVNQDESEAYFDVSVDTEEDFEGLVDRWLATGVQNVVITRGAKGSIYGNQEGDRETLFSVRTDNVVDVTGAGDSYSSGIIYGFVNGYSALDSIQFGMTNAYYTIQTEETVRMDLNEETLNNEKTQLFLKETK